MAVNKKFNKGNFLLPISLISIDPIFNIKSDPSTVIFLIWEEIIFLKLNPWPKKKPNLLFLPPKALTYKSPAPAGPNTVSCLPLYFLTMIVIYFNDCSNKKEAALK